MNKLYPVKKLYSANLQKVCSDNSREGLKNIIGLIISYNGEEYFYSILDDCIFKLLPKLDEISNNYEKYSNKLFVDVYARNTSYMKSFGIELYDRLQTDFITKKQLIKSKSILIGYFSDLDYDDLKTDTNLDYENITIITDYLIETELEYEQKLDRPIMYTDGIRPPSSAKKLIR